MEYCIHCMNAMEAFNKTCPYCGKDTTIAASSHQLPPGTILNGKYLIGAALGEGGFGITYIGRDLKLDMKIAVKEYYPNGFVNRNNTISTEVSTATTGERKAIFEKGRERFLLEARTLAKFCGEPGVVDVRDFFEENNTAYIVMEYLDGEDLKEYLKRKGTLTPEQTISMLTPLMQVLTKIHEQGLVHRDISPDNIRLVSNGIKLMDFGAARDVSAAANKSLSVMLKPGYAPEEQYRSKGIQGPWTDVYALCATIYKCITGITPDDSTQRVFKDELKTPTELGISMDSVLEAALMKGLSVHQKDRHQSIPELMNGFRGIDTEPTMEEEERTVYGEKCASEEDQSTRYIMDDDVTSISMGTETKEEDVPVYVGNKDSQPAKRSQRNSKIRKNIGAIALLCVLGIVAVVAISTIFSALNKSTIGGEQVDKDKKYLRVSDEVITAEDMKNILSMGSLESLSFSNCSFDSEALELLGTISSKLMNLSFVSCKGIKSFQPISKLRFLTSLTIKDCSLTNEKLEEIDFMNKDYLMNIDFSKNQLLSDISKLDEISDTLNELNVSQTAVTDFSSLKDCVALTSITANGNRITSLDSIKNTTLFYLKVAENAITDISAVANCKYLRYFYASKNKITDISALKDHEILTYLDLSENEVTDISALSNCTSIIELKISDNRVNSLAALSECTKLTCLYADNNQLTSFDGLEKAIELKVVRAADNKITDIHGLTNSTILQEISLSRNEISDISVLAKSAESLQRVYLSNNKLSDISALKGTTQLQYLNLDVNEITNLDALSDSTNLLGISAENNRITSIDGLFNLTKLTYLCLPHNKIESMEPVAQLIPRAEKDFAVIDLSNNNITKFSLSAEKNIGYFAVYNNPIESYEQIANGKGGYFLFNYQEGMDYSGLKDAFRYYRVIDCPLDKQIAVKKAIFGEQNYSSFSHGVYYSSAEEAEHEIKKAKSNLLIKPND